MDSSNWRVKRDPSDTPAKEQTHTPMHSFQQRRGGSSPFGQSPGRSPKQEQSRDGFRKPLNDKTAEQAIEDGRRVYVGNMPYEASVKDVESLFKDIADGVEAINMSVDPMTGRNPSYCFVDFTTKDLADHVMQEYNGRDFLHRPLKVKPGVKSGTGKGRFDIPPRIKEANSPVYERWSRFDRPEDVNTAATEGRRLYVGGLPRFNNQADSNTKIRELFKSAGFDVDIVSKAISRHESLRDEPGNHNYCFVDLKTKEETNAARKALDGLEKWGWNLKVSVSTGVSGKLGERRRLFVGGLPTFPDQETTDAEIRDLFKGFELKSITRQFAPREEKASEEGNHHYCFVELVNEEQTDVAVKELDWKDMWGWKIRVKPALGNSKPLTKSWGPHSKIRD